MVATGCVFRCGNCGAPHPAPSPGHLVVCPFCGTQQVFAMPPVGTVEIRGTVLVQGGLQVQGDVRIEGGALVISAGESDFASNALLKASLRDSVQRLEPGFGFLVAGMHDRRLRAIDAWTRRVLWEVDPGGHLDGEHIALRALRLYSAAEHILSCRDARSGQLLWQTRLPDDVDEDPEGIALRDPYPADAAQAVIVVKTIDEKVTAYDRATGTPRWQVAEDGFWSDLMIEGPGCLATYQDSAVRVISPLAGPSPVLSIPSDATVYLNLLGAQLAGASDEQGMVIDLPSARTLHVGRMPEEMFDIDAGLPVIAGGLLWAAAPEALGGYPRGRLMRGAPIPGHEIAALGGAGDTLVVLVKKSPGTPRQILIGLDPATLTIRWAQQDLGVWVDEVWSEEAARTLALSGPFVLVPAKGKEIDDNETTDLQGVDARTGALLWRSNLPGELERVSVVQGYFRLLTDRQVLLVRPDTGERVAKFPWND
jgi:outer membrane protein assembly factor BamB